MLSLLLTINRQAVSGLHRNVTEAFALVQGGRAEEGAGKKQLPAALRKRLAARGILKVSQNPLQT